jgi:hypothetical protein
VERLKEGKKGQRPKGTPCLKHKQILELVHCPFTLSLKHLAGDNEILRYEGCSTTLFVLFNLESIHLTQVLSQCRAGAQRDWLFQSALCQKCTSGILLHSIGGNKMKVKGRYVLRMLKSRIWTWWRAGALAKALECRMQWEIDMGEKNMAGSHTFPKVPLNTCSQGTHIL